VEIWVALTDDWELRGNGSGRVVDLQRRPALRLMELYEGLGIRSTFNVEIMQQLAFERHAHLDPALAADRDAWGATVREMLRRGFDVQLHLHPQWWEAERVNEWWKLGRKWNIADYEPKDIQRMVREAIDYLAPIVAPRKVVSFRGGSWGIGPPSRAIFNALADHGLVIDVSIVNGSRYDGEGIRLDYTQLDSPYMAYRPDLDDARRVAPPGGGAAIVELPTQSVSRAQLFSRVLSGLGGGGRRREALTALAQIAMNSRLGSRLKDAIRPPSKAPGQPDFVMSDPFGYQSGRASSDIIFDLSSGFPALLFERMADICIERARKSAREFVVLVLENHTKDLQSDRDFRRIERTITHIRTKFPDVQFRTLAEVAREARRLV
jgi:hypothetical protein